MLSISGTIESLGGWVDLVCPKHGCLIVDLLGCYFDVTLLLTYRQTELQKDVDDAQHRSPNRRDSVYNLCERSLKAAAQPACRRSASHHPQ